ncbi:MAG: choice-of-anchor J domain-containing protein [Bacteroides sp.]|nr:choice-of-anchor J domain-containing protein [Ruminococcus flavefaciens]MCM1555211.1 choice-of-anchor J domain-containing protein [Bacteroides sp.]
MKIKSLIIIFLLSFPLLQAQEKTTEGFEGAYFPPKGWTVRYANAHPTPGNLMGLSGDEYKGGLKSFRFSSSDANQGIPYDQYLISPELDCPTADTFSFVCLTTTGSRNYRVGWSSTGTAEEDFTYTPQKEDSYDWEFGKWWNTYRKTDLPAGTGMSASNMRHPQPVPGHTFIDNVKLPPVKDVRLSAPVNLAYEEGSGKISWEEVSSATRWEVAVVKSSAFSWGGLSGEEVTGREFTPSSLDPLTGYVAYVRGKDGEDVSAWSSPLFFRTGCPPYHTVPFFEGFENLVADDVLPECHEAENGTDFKCVREQDYAGSAWLNEKPHAGKGFSFFRNYDKTFSNRYLSPAVRTEAGKTYKLSFWWATDENFGFDTLALGVQAETGAHGVWLKVEERPHSAVYREMCAYYTPSAAQNVRMVVYLAGKHDKKRNLKAERLYIDDLRVEDVTDMPSLSGLALAGRAEARSFSVAWKESRTPSRRQISLGMHTPKVDFNPEDSLLALVPDGAGATLSSDRQGRALRPDTEYDVYVRIADGNKTSPWVGPLTVRTAKDTLRIPFVEDCAGLTEKGLLPEKTAWISHLGNGSTDGMTTPVGNSTYNRQEGHTDSRYILFQPQGTAQDTSEEWIIMRGVILERESYDFSAWFLTNVEKGIDTLAFHVGESPEPSAMTTRIACRTAYGATAYEQLVATYENTRESTPLYFGIRIKGHGGGYYDKATLCIDDISLRPTPSCRPAEEVAVSATEGISAQVSWSGSAQEYEVAYCKGGSFDFGESDTVKVPAETSVRLSGLEPQTLYWVSVRGYCQTEGLFSEWTEPMPFRTACLPNGQYPLHENFEDFENGCWLTAGWNNGAPDESASWKIHERNSSGTSDAEPLQGGKAIRFRSNFLTSSQYGDLTSPRLEADGATYTGIEFYWWNIENCEGTENIKPWLYLMAEREGEDMQTIDSVRLCGCQASEWARYRRVFDFPISGLTLRTFGANTEYNLSNTLLDSLTLDLFNTEDLPRVTGLQVSVRDNAVTLTWDGAAAQTSSFRANGSYVVLRDGVKVGETSLNSYEDSLLQKGEYTYGVVYMTRAGLPADTAYTQAEVTVNTYGLTLAVEGEGDVIPEAGVHHYLSGKKVSLQAQAVPGKSFFAGWKCGADTVKENPLEVTLTSDTLVTALFQTITYPITVEVEGEGAVRPEPGMHVCKSLDTLTFEAASSNRYWLFEKWILNGDSVISEASFRWIVTDTLHARAVFSRPSYKLTMKVQGEGTVEPAAGSHDLLSGDTVHLKAIPSEGHHFVRWTVSGQTVTDSLYLFVMERATTVTGYFEENPVTPPDPPVANEENETFSVRLYPNPVRNTLYIEASEIVDEVILYSTGGNEVLRVHGKSAKPNVSVENIPQGLYLVRLRMRSGYERIERIIIQ